MFSTVPLQETNNTIVFSQSASNSGYASMCMYLQCPAVLSGQQRVLVERVIVRKPWRNAVNAFGMRFCIDLSGVFFFFFGKELGNKKQKSTTCLGWVTEIPTCALNRVRASGPSILKTFPWETQTYRQEKPRKAGQRDKTSSSEVGQIPGYGDVFLNSKMGLWRVLENLFHWRSFSLL